MFWHNFKYEILHGLRVKDLLFWLILFPIVLGLFFKIAFDGIYEKSEKFSQIPVAVVESAEDKTFHSVMDGIEQSDDPLFKVTYTDNKKALDMLEEQEIKGIIRIDGGERTLSVHGEGIEQSIIKSFLEQYAVQEQIITDTAMTNPQNLENVISALNSEVKTSKIIPLTEGDPDPYVSYFYNLIAMVALFGSITGLHISMENQANLHPLGARKNCSPTPKFISLTASLLGSYIIQTICVIISVSYVAFVLKIDFGSRLPLVYLSGILGGILGVSMGFMVGSFGSMNENAKTGIAMTVSMLCCFFSGLMVGNMKAVVAEKAPWFNEINPAALISDSFYCLEIYSDYDRYIAKNITMVIISAVFIVIGFLLTRRKKYASL